ncbi:hypothetical protein CJ206_00710 [Dolosicoccus paucivorans]|uniref:type III-A CRISPR-associated CARF protein Csm6 n=1 Tax=Dolosicoccus paucivorans TaxID=84521 RepID=UPI000C8093D7|nr:hypothetical protein [Dolosicoccus paucivorans]PMB85061.1 hypothetical protein CJ206_00710 [Dolosicoccus paucivorans]
MAQKILFSPVGTADPVANGMDGALIHIIRHYKPDYVYIYLTDKFKKLKQEDEAVYRNGKYSNRYDYALEQIQKQTGHHFDYEYVEGSSSEEPHLFDPMLKEFDEQLVKIYADHPDVDTLYLNVSSGTPAMKNALLTLSIYNDLGVLEPLQVAGPEKRSHQSMDDKDDYILQWENNEDTNDTERRFEPMDQLPNYSNKLEKNIVRNLINQYNYHGAWSIVKANREVYGETFVNMLGAVVGKYDLNRNEVRKFNNRLEDKYIVPLHDSEVEYMILWNLKLVKLNEVTDYLRAMSPTLVYLFDKIAQQAYKNLSIYQKKDRDGELMWDEDRLWRENTELYDVLSGDNNRFFKHPTAHQLLNIVRHYYKGSTAVVKNLEKMRDFEKKLRNVAAHQPRAFSKEEIIKIAHMSIEDFNKQIRVLAQNCNFVSKEQWKEYDQLNELLSELLI